MSRQITERPDHQRLAIADEAARIIHDEGLADFRSAKYKALERLGLRPKGTRLPSNEEIERALAIIDDTSSQSLLASVEASVGPLL